MEEMFEICGFDFRGEEYILEDQLGGENLWTFSKDKKHIGLNTGCGGRWTSRLWLEEYWIGLAQQLIQAGYEPVILGGKHEDEKNQRIAIASGALYPGYYNLKKFIHLVNQMDCVVTAVTMAMHLAIGLKKHLVLFNNIFNRNEFHLYNRGMILEPEIECGCFFSPTCENDCMTALKVETVFEAVKSLMD
jgi:heptosyltransferase-2